MIYGLVPVVWQFLSLAGAAFAIAMFIAILVATATLFFYRLAQAGEAAK